MAQVSVDLGTGTATVAGRKVTIREHPAGLRLYGLDGPVLRALTFGERQFAVRAALGCEDPPEALARGVLRLALGDQQAQQDDPVLEALALYLAGATVDDQPGQGLADVALLVVRATGWSATELDAATAASIDAWALSLAPPSAGAADGWTRLRLAEGTAAETRAKLAANLLARAAVRWPAAADPAESLGWDRPSSSAGVDRAPFIRDQAVTSPMTTPGDTTAHDSRVLRAVDGEGPPGGETVPGAGAEVTDAGFASGVDAGSPDAQASYSGTDGGDHRPTSITDMEDYGPVEAARSLAETRRWPGPDPANAGRTDQGSAGRGATALDRTSSSSEALEDADHNAASSVAALDWADLGLTARGPAGPGSAAPDATTLVWAGPPELASPLSVGGPWSPARDQDGWTDPVAAASGHAASGPADYGPVEAGWPSLFGPGEDPGLAAVAADEDLAARIARLLQDESDLRGLAP